MDTFEVYNIFHSVRNHFQQEKFDAFRYGFKTRNKRETFEKDKNRHFYEKASRTYPARQDITAYFLANVLENPKVWIGGCNKDAYIDWKRRNEGLTYFFKEGCRGLAKDFKDPILLFRGNPPAILNEYLGGRINLETLTIFDMFSDAVSNMKDEHGMFDTHKMLVRKYRPFINVDVSKMAGLAKAEFDK